ncbi:MAG TPA: fluoride efflux transporter CrcB [Burkholderiales bacterium]|nr:fluoride efflux transporter CrcB [Burkholderiales bacterium]
MTPDGFLAVGIGGALGCWLRWVLGIAFNPLFPNMLMGTLAANLTGGYLIGVAIEYFTHHDSLPPELRLFVIVGFLGGLTTFASFSAEAVELLADNQLGWAFVMVASHLLGSLAMTWLGILSMRSLHA